MKKQGSVNFKLVTIALASLLLVACTGEGVDEFAFRTTLQNSLVDKCGEKDKACISAVKTQIKPCMEKSDWRRFVDNQDDKAELKRFTSQFYGCIVDKDGNPFFHPNV